ncbi:MAG: adenine deaminase [Calditrichaeota bacterium]|nr:adenine deaminase [Calditrichota bacterium]
MSSIDYARWQARIAAARGDRKVDILFVGGKIVNVFNSCIEEKPVAVYDGHVVGFDEYPTEKIIDLKGKYLLPGFIEGHIHIESSKLTPPRFAEVVVKHGTTTVIADPHEIANVWGITGIKFMIENARNLPLKVYYMLPSCVPATDMETAGASLQAKDLKPLLDDPGVLGVGEMMNFPGAFLGIKSVLEKAALGMGGRPIDGHAPGLLGKNLSAYMIAGPKTDHECFTLAEAEEKLAIGMRVMIRQGSTAHNLEALLPLVNPATERRCMFVSDDRRAGDLLNEGHLDSILRLAVKSGLDPVTAVRMVTLNTAETFGLTGKGAIRPGWRADLVAVEDLSEFKVTDVWNGGRAIVQDGEYLAETPSINNPVESGSLPVPELSESAFHVKDIGQAVRVIGIVPDQIITTSETAVLPMLDGMVISDTDNDIVKLIVVERHTGRGGVAVGFVKGLGIREGAIASTVAHDSHNIIAAGVDDHSLLNAVRALVASGGGQAVVKGDKILAELPLPIAGLMSDRPAFEIAEIEEHLIAAAKELGCRLNDPFMTLSFLALPVIPELKLTDLGLVDVGKFQLVSLYA